MIGLRFVAALGISLAVGLPATAQEKFAFSSLDADLSGRSSLLYLLCVMRRVNSTRSSLTSAPLGCYLQIQAHGGQHNQDGRKIWKLFGAERTVNACTLQPRLFCNLGHVEIFERFSDRAANYVWVG